MSDMLIDTFLETVQGFVTKDATEIEFEPAAIEVPFTNDLDIDLSGCEL